MTSEAFIAAWKGLCPNILHLRNLNYMILKPELIRPGKWSFKNKAFRIV